MLFVVCKRQLFASKHGFTHTYCHCNTHVFSVHLGWSSGFTLVLKDVTFVICRTIFQILTYCQAYRVSVRASGVINPPFSGWSAVSNQPVHLQLWPFQGLIYLHTLAPSCTSLLAHPPFLPTTTAWILLMYPCHWTHFANFIDLLATEDERTISLWNVSGHSAKIAVSSLRRSESSTVTVHCCLC